MPYTMVTSTHRIVRSSSYVTEKMFYLKYLRTFNALLHPEGFTLKHFKPSKIIKAV